MRKYFSILLLLIIGLVFLPARLMRVLLRFKAHRVFRVDPLNRLKGKTFGGIGPRDHKNMLSTGIPGSGRTIFNERRRELNIPGGGREISPFFAERGIAPPRTPGGAPPHAERGTSPAHIERGGGPSTGKGVFKGR
ncbi:MAG TPA: hypothetical protein VF790_02245 [Dissulfurispiraceae bacterium]